MQGPQHNNARLPVTSPYARHPSLLLPNPGSKQSGRPKQERSRTCPRSSCFTTTKGVLRKAAHELAEKLGHWQPLLCEDRIGIFMRALHHLAKGKAREYGARLRRYDELARVTGSHSGPNLNTKKARPSHVQKISLTSIVDFQELKTAREVLPECEYHCRK